MVGWELLQTRNGVGDCDGARANPAMEAIGGPMAAFWRCAVVCNDFLWFFIRCLFFGLVCWFGLISPYSIELGFRGYGLVDVSFLWCYSREYVLYFRCFFVIFVMVNFPCTWSGCFGIWCRIGLNGSF